MFNGIWILIELVAGGFDRASQEGQVVDGILLQWLGSACRSAMTGDPLNTQAPQLLDIS
jgi:hypothetical protein